MPAGHTTFGFAAFLAQADAVGRGALLLLALMSLVSWYLILTRAIDALREQRRSRAFLARFRAAPTRETLAAVAGEGAYERIAAEAHRVAGHHAVAGARGREEAADAKELLAAALQAELTEQALRAESGMTALASVGATAPFVGLFGTVWGVYNALVAIGMAGQGTLDKVAGPVGEALIMTALGLAVAIPAVLAYNVLVRRNRRQAARLERFAHQLLVLVATGAVLSAAPSPEGR